jgi:hypothetical protein
MIDAILGPEKAHASAIVALAPADVRIPFTAETET